MEFIEAPGRNVNRADPPRECPPAARISKSLGSGRAAGESSETSLSLPRHRPLRKYADFLNRLHYVEHDSTFSLSDKRLIASKRARKILYRACEISQIALVVGDIVRALTRTGLSVRKIDNGS